ncbi:response regulator [Pleomorphomonas diazotrophica]|uniref:Response regulator n=1 Tax=Pleomorphomonas diazotrophica TaxID=1166257 RepID=A0A1I4S4P6_9HYPH|nr:response regulator [Pleomorphomonas diazotrophica]PKR89959.1 response regulator [Pleomorphomonas diazotrophica]SFM59371.1 Response regulator receiver domain-containing protein [Pleomorphomonas diazotrophica]
MQASILIVEDEWLIAEDYASTLTQAGYYVVGPCPSVDAALAALDQESIDAAVLDIQLHDETSFPVAKRLQSLGIPFAFLSGQGREHLPSELATCSLLPKPVARAALLTVASQLSSDATLQKKRR